MDWKLIYKNISNFFSVNFFNILLFFATIAIGVILIKVMLNLTKRILGKTKMEQITQHFLFVIIKFLMYLVLVLILLGEMGVELTGVLTAISALLLAVGMALQNNISNVANGIVVVSTHMFNKGDYIIVGDIEGSIQEINFLFTTITTFDNKKITIPNSTIINSSVTNLDGLNKRRVDFTFSVAYENDVELVKSIVTSVMVSDGRIYLEPKPFCKLKYLKQNSLDFFCNCWCDTADFWDVYYYVTENVYNEFKRNKITFGFSQIEIREKSDLVVPVVKTPLQTRTEKNRKATENQIDIENDNLTELIKKSKHRLFTKKKNRQ